jgi:hypothetical protein
VCRAGWLGYNCSLLDDKIVNCLPDCSPHGKFDLDAGKCVCDRGWTGPDCSHGESPRFQIPKLEAIEILRNEKKFGSKWKESEIRCERNEIKKISRKI